MFKKSYFGCFLENGNKKIQDSTNFFHPAIIIRLHQESIHHTNTCPVEFNSYIQFKSSFRFENAFNLALENSINNTNEYAAGLSPEHETTKAVWFR